MRVRGVIAWFKCGRHPQRYCSAWLTERRALLASLETGVTRIEATVGGRIALVASPFAGALRLAYRVAPVVVALNEQFQFRNCPPHRKFTVAQYTRGFVDFAKLAAALSLREPGWGGTSTILGSPQGIASRLAVEEVLDIVADCLNN